jgi:hypothetical protein
MNISEYKVNLLIPGAGKSGTTSLHAYLNQHPNICMSENKEPHYFAIDTEYNKGIGYHNALFTCNTKKDIVYYGESSTTYFISKAAVERIKKDLSAPRFIFILRNPIDRIFSHFSWIRNNMGLETLSFEAEIMSDRNAVFDANKPLKGGAYKNYLQESFYGSAVAEYIKAFGRENLYVITTEQLKSAPLSTLNECFAFLNLSNINDIKETFAGITEKKVNVTPGFMKSISFILPNKLFGRAKNKVVEKFFIKREELPGITADQREWLKQMLVDEVAKLREITGQKFDEWHDFKLN